MSKRPGFVYNGSKIEIVPFCGPPAKTPKLSTKITPQQVPKVVSNVRVNPQNAQINQSQNYSVSMQSHSKDCEKIPVVIQKKDLASDLTSKKTSNVFQVENKSNYSQKDFNKAQASCNSWASNYLCSIGHTYKNPIKLNLSTTKTSKDKLLMSIPKVNTLRKERSKKTINANNDYSTSQAAARQANLKVLVNAEEVPKQGTAACAKPKKQSIHTISNPDNTFIKNNSNTKLHQFTNSVQNNIDKHTLNNSSSPKTTKPLAKFVSEKVASSKKDHDISTSKKEKVKAFECVADKKKHIENTLTSTRLGSICKNIDNKPITSCFNKNTNSYKKKHHTSEKDGENKPKIINFKTKDTRCKSSEFKDKFRNKSLDKPSGKSRSNSKSGIETPRHQTSKEKISKSELEHRSSSQGPKRSTSKCINTSSKDTSIENYNSSSNSLFDNKKSYKDDFAKSNIKSEVIKRKQDDKVAKVSCKSERRKFVKSVLSSPGKIKNKTCTTKSFVRSCSTSDTKTAKQIKQNKITDLREKLSHRSLNELFSKKRYQNLLVEKRDNLKITIPNTLENKKIESESEEELELSTNVKISSPKSVKNKTIKLIINVRYEQPTTSNAKSSDLTENEVDESNNLDLSFLDDINIDEIVDSLKDCENNSEFSKSGDEVFVSSTDESNLDSTLSLQSCKSINNNISKSILNNSNMSDEQSRSIRESQNVVLRNETLSKLDGIKREPIETENAGGFRDTVDYEIRNNNTDKHAEKFKKHESHAAISFEVTSQDDNSLIEKEIKTEPPEIEYVNEAVNDVNSIKEEVPDELQAKLAAIKSWHVRRCTQEESTHEFTEKDKIKNENKIPSMNSLCTIQTGSHLNLTLDTEEISLLDKVNIKNTTDNTKHKKENNNSITMDLSLRFNEPRDNSIELVAGGTYLSSSDNIELEKMQVLECQNIFKEKNQLENGRVSVTKQVNKELLSISDLTHNIIDFINVDDIKSVVNAKRIIEDTPKLKTKIDGNSPLKTLYRKESLSIEYNNYLKENKHREIENNKSIASAKTQKTGNVTTTVEPSKAKTNVKNQEKISVGLQITSNSNTSSSSKLNVSDLSYLRFGSPQNTQKINIDESYNQDHNTNLQFIVANEKSPKLLTIDENSNKKKHSEVTKSTHVKSEVSLKLRFPVKPPHPAIDRETKNDIKEILNETIIKSIEAVTKHLDNKPTTVKPQSEDAQNTNDVESLERCKPRSHSPIKSPKCDKSNANNTKEVASPENEVNGALHGVDKVRGRKLEQRMLEYLRDEYKVLSVVNKGQYSIIYKCKDSLGRAYAAKVIKDQDKRYILGIAKEKMLKQLQKDIPRCKLNFVHFVNGFTIQGRWCFLMEYYPKNLKQVLDENNIPFNIDEVQDLSKQLISAVTVLRTNNVIHSDIKPTHIMMNSANNRLKLCGFDRAGPRETKIFLPNIGTVNYRAPEIILGHSAGYSIDVWSTALVMYEMATNIILFPGSFNNDILFKQMCTLGSIPFDMINNSLFKEQHFIEGVRFIRQPAEHGQAFKFKNYFYKSKRLECTIRGAYYKYWAASRKDKKEEDIAKLHSFKELLVKMLVMHPKHRIPIEFVYFNPFIHDLPADLDA